MPEKLDEHGAYAPCEYAIDAIWTDRKTGDVEAATIAWASSRRHAARIVKALYRLDDVDDPTYSFRTTDVSGEIEQ